MFNAYVFGPRWNSKSSLYEDYVGSYGSWGVKKVTVTGKVLEGTHVDTAWENRGFGGLSPINVHY